MLDLSFEEVVVAYFDCRRRKRRSLFATEFEFNLEENLFELFLELKEGRYKIGSSLAFVVDQPKIREIWCATFRDRVVHHVIYNRLSPAFYKKFIRNSFACIPDRGTLDASDSLWAGMRSITKNWQEDRYFLSADIKNFFVSIDKRILFEILRPKIHISWLESLVDQVIFHDPKLDCILRSNPEAFQRVPRHKSLWHTETLKGLPIGNLTSQFFANVYLNELDQFVKHQLKIKYYYRYVDDFVILANGPTELNFYFGEITKFLSDRLKLELHPFKKRIAPIFQGIDFVGYLHKPFRRYPRRRTVSRLISVVNQWKKKPDPYTEANLKKFQASVNSYFGLIRPTASYNLRRKIGEEVCSLFIWPDEKFLKLKLPKSD